MKRRFPLLPEAAKERLKKRLRDRLKLSPLERFAAGEDFSDEATYRLKGDIDRCFPPFGEEWWNMDPPMPEQLESIMADIEDRRGQNRDDDEDEIVIGPYMSDEDEALGELLASNWELDPVTRAYIVRKYLTKNVHFPTLISRNREHYEFAETIKRVKLLLRKSGLKAHEADQAIADDLGMPVATLLQRLQRAPRWI